MDDLNLSESDSDLSPFPTGSRMTRTTTRRQFLATAAAGLTILPSARMVRGTEANERLNLAVMGTMYNAAHMLKAPHLYNAPIVAFCDPDTRNVAKAQAMWKEEAERTEPPWSERYRRMAAGQDIAIHSDIRKLLDEQGDSIDALVVSYYDHLHGVACGLALGAGKPVLSERPLGMNISDARHLRRLAAETKLPTTYRSPGTAGAQFRRGMELVEEGALGEVREVHVWLDRGGPDRDAVPSSQQPIPEWLDWDAWLGPLPAREFHPDWMAYSNWRETCNGGLGVFGAHATIFPFMALKLRQLWDRAKGNDEQASPIQVTADCARLNQVSFPRWERIVWQLPARGEMPPVEVTWHHGPDFGPGARELLHEKLRRFGITDAAEADALLKNAGSLLVGTEGAILADDHSVHLTALPAAKFETIETKRPQRIPAAQNIYADWIRACRGEDTHILANFDNGGPLSELLMLGNIATLYPEQTLQYDPVQGQITNRTEANTHLGFEYREGWKVW